MTPSLEKLRSRRNLTAQVLMTAVRSFSDYTVMQERLQSTSCKTEDVEIDFQSIQRREQKLIEQIRSFTTEFNDMQTLWSIALHDASTGAKAELASRLKDLTFDWANTAHLGDQIDAASIRWGIFGVAAQGGESTPLSEQICGMVASGATPEELIRLRHALQHMPRLLGGDDYRHCCLIALGLEWRRQGIGSSMDEVKSVLHWFDRAQSLMVGTRQTTGAFFQRLGVQ